MMKTNVKKEITRYIYMLISSFIYAVMNVIYGDLTNTFLWLDFVQYFLFYIILSMAYVKYDYNIFVPISIKFIYNLFQTILLVLISIVGWLIYIIF